MLEFILNQKKIKTEHQSEKRPAEQEDTNRQENTPPPPKIPKLETDSGLNSVTSNSPKDKPCLPIANVIDPKCECKSVNEDEADDPDPDQEVKSEDAAELIGTFVSALKRPKNNPNF